MFNKNTIIKNLGKKFFNILINHFNNVSEADALYKICITDRSFDVMYLLGQLSKNKNSINNIYSPASIEFCIPKIADCYLRSGYFPHILFIGDLLWHGRQTNEFLDNFTLLIFNYLKLHGCKKGYITIRNDLFDYNSKIIVALQNERPLLLDPVYQMSLVTGKNREDVETINTLLGDESRLCSLFMEISYQFMEHHFVIKKENAYEKVIINKLINQAKNDGFKTVSSSFGDFLAKPIGSGYMTLQLVEDMLIPRVVFPSFKGEMIDQILVDLPVDERSVELAMTVLGHQLLIKLAKEAGCERDLPQSLSNVERIKAYFGNSLNNYLSTLSQDTHSRIELNELAKWSEQNVSETVYASSIQDDPFEWLSDIIYKEQILSEASAYEVCRGYKNLNNENSVLKKYSLNSLMNFAKSRISDYEFLHYFFFLESLSFVSMKYHQSEGTYTSIYNTKTQALSLWPIRYIQALGVLGAIEADYAYDLRGVVGFIENHPELFADYDVTTDELVEFAKLVKTAGLTFGCLMCSYSYWNSRYFQVKELHSEQTDGKTLIKRFIDTYSRYFGK